MSENKNLTKLDHFFKLFGGILFVLSFLVTAYSVYQSSRTQAGQFKLEQIRTINEGLSYIKNPENPARGVILSHLMDAGVAPIGLNLKNIILFGITCENKCTTGNFYRTNLTAALFKSTTFIKGNFTHTNLQNASIIRSNLSKSNFYKTNLTDTFFYESNLSDTDLTKANICGAIFDNSNLKNTQFNTLAFYQKNCKNNIPCISHTKQKIPYLQKCSEKKLAMRIEKIKQGY